MSEDKNKELQEEFMGYSTFASMPDRGLRSFNRLTTFLKIFSQKGRETSQLYIRNFDEEAKKDIGGVHKAIKELGVAEVRRSVIGGRMYA